MECSLQPPPQYGEQGGKGGVGLRGWAWRCGERGDSRSAVLSGICGAVLDLYVG